MVEKKHSGLCVAKSLLLLKMRVRGRNESQEYAILQYIEVICLILIVDRTLGCVCLKWRTAVEIDLSVIQVTSSLE